MMDILYISGTFQKNFHDIYSLTVKTKILQTIAKFLNVFEIWEW